MLAPWRSPGVCDGGPTSFVRGAAELHLAGMGNGWLRGELMPGSPSYREVVEEISDCCPSYRHSEQADHSTG